MKKTSNIQHRTLNFERAVTTSARTSAFDVQCSVFDVFSFGYEQPQIRLPPTAEEPRLHRRGRAHARARHRGHDGDLQRGLCRRVASVAVPGIRAACGSLDPNATD